MGETDRGCCDKCAKSFIMAINIVIVLIGGAILAAGVYWQLSDTGFYKEIFNHDIFNIPILAIVVGSLLLLVGLAGFLGACCEAMFLLKVYMGFLIVIMLVEIILAVGCVAMKTTVEDYATERTYEMIGYVGNSTADEEGIIEATLDLVQQNFECCGVTGPTDWAKYNSIYNTTGAEAGNVPTSCCMADYSSDDTCGESFADNEKIYTDGCKTSLWNFIENNLTYVGIVCGAICILQIMILIISSKFRTMLEDEDYANF